MSGQTPASGWYPDGSGALRWWDGSSWTAHVQPPRDTPVAAPSRHQALDVAAPRAGAGEIAGAGSSVVPGGVVQTPRSREGGRQILIGLGLLAAFAILTVGTQMAAARGSGSDGGRVFIGAAGVGALFLLRGLSARYASTPVVLLGFLGTAALVAGVLLMPLDLGAGSAAPTPVPPSAGAPQQIADSGAQAPWRPDAAHDWIPVGSTVAYRRVDGDAARCAAGTSCAVAVVASRRACARLKLDIDLLDGAGLKRRSTSLVLKGVDAGRGVSTRITTKDDRVEAYRITGARCL